MTAGDGLERYGRQILFSGVGDRGQQRLRDSRVLVVGCGALGSHIVDTLVRAGVGLVRIVDRDFLEINNLQRQVLFDENDVHDGLPKAVAAAIKSGRINASVRVDPVVQHFSSANARALVGEVDLVLDGTDNFATRYLINDVCLSLGRPWIYGGVAASYGMSMTVVPGQTPCFRCVFPQPPPPGAALTCDIVGIIEPAVAVVAAHECVEAFKLLVGATDRCRRGLIHFDLWENRTVQMNVGERLADCPACSKGEYEFLTGGREASSGRLCGRDAIQVLPPVAAALDLAGLADRLRQVGQVTVNRFLLRLKVSEYELVLFPDGRVIVKGTTDDTTARTLCSQYFGL